MENAAQFGEVPQPAPTKKSKDKQKEQKQGLKKPFKQHEIWEDFRQLYMDFNLHNDRVIRDKVLFVNSFDSDFNARQEEQKYDSKGYFLLDT